MPKDLPTLRLTILPYTLAICRLAPDSKIPEMIYESRFLAITRTEEELSIICEQALAPAGWQAEPGWRALKVNGPLDFSLVGILASLLAPLAQAGVSVFAQSTYDTDYILVKAAQLEQASAALSAAGYPILEG